MRSLALAALLLAGCAAAAAPPPNGASATQWLGIPYATAERWELPEVKNDWADAAPFDAMGPACPQRGQLNMVEDCLFLNVFAPEAARNAPVMVWIHGGGFINGFGGDGPATFTRDGFVVVTFNYRLGKLGFHDWAGWDESDPRNFGQADMVAALQWVQANIARFGGDPDDVTLFGHSAGGMGVQLMMVDDRADGLFHKAWSHAGYGSWPFPKALNPSPAERMRLSILPLQKKVSPEMLVNELSAYHLPYTDAPHLKAQPVSLYSGRDVPFVAGSNSYDGAGTLQGAGFTVESFLARVDSPQLRAAYSEDFAVSDEQAAQRIFGDLRYGLSSQQAAELLGGALFVYDSRQDGAPGAYHGQQYEDVFSGASSPFRDAMVDFARTGNPGWASLDNGDYAQFTPALKITALDARKAKTEALEALHPKPSKLQDAMDRLRD